MTSEEMILQLVEELARAGGAEPGSGNSGEFRGRRGNSAGNSGDGAIPGTVYSIDFRRPSD